MLEPIQGEGGINIARPEFLRGLRELCDRRGLVLIYDEVQTGCGRTGKWFGYQHDGIVPDIMTLAKALGGGVAVGALVAKPGVAAKLVPGTHASTFGGNPLACAAGIAAFQTIEEENLLENAIHVGRHAVERLGEMKKTFRFVRDVRGRGLMIGMELDRPGKDVVQRCLENGLLINCTHDTVIRMLPAMDIKHDEIDEGLDILEKALAAEKV
jgi:acetylornithine/N-succinyldiaminopimelate aminotransferase